VNKDFKEYLSILNKMGEHLKLWEYEELDKLIHKTRKGFYDIRKV
jgi:hypothetical protein